MLGAALRAAGEARGHKEEDKFASVGTVELQGQGTKTGLLQDVRPYQHIKILERGDWEHTLRRMGRAGMLDKTRLHRMSCRTRLTKVLCPIGLVLWASPACVHYRAGLVEGQDQGEGNNAGDKNELLDLIDHTYLVESLTIIREPRIILMPSHELPNVIFSRLGVHSR